MDDKIWGMYRYMIMSLSVPPLGSLDQTMYPRPVYKVGELNEAVAAIITPLCVVGET